MCRIYVEDAARPDSSVYDWMTWTFVACGPFWPCVTSNSTFAPSANVEATHKTQRAAPSD